MTIADQIRQVRLNIDQFCQDAQRSNGSVKLMAVSKTHPAESIQQAYESGITEFGESYLQEAIDKIEKCRHLPITWHFIGPIQSNKTRLIAENFDWVHSVDREKILRRLSEQRPAELGPLRVCLQANLFNEPQKQGVSVGGLPSLLAFADDLPNIELRGIMVIPPPQVDYEQQLKQFMHVKSLFEDYASQYPLLDTLSMGMSNDIKAAIVAGSNIVRVGTAIFGPRGTNHQK